MLLRLVLLRQSGEVWGNRFFEFLPQILNDIRLMFRLCYYLPQPGKYFRDCLIQRNWDKLSCATHRRNHFNPRLFTVLGPIQSSGCMAIITSDLGIPKLQRKTIRICGKTRYRRRTNGNGLESPMN
jgi:hypothetical protein